MDYFFSLLIMFFYGKVLEQAWGGSFKFNMYYLIGTFGTILASFIVEAIIRAMGGTFAYPVNNYYLYMSLLLAVAQIMPDYEIRIYFILPVKLKYLGYIYGGAILLLQFVTGDIGTQVTIAFSLLNFFVFFGPGLLSKSKSQFRKQQFKQAHKPKPRVKTRTRNDNNKNGEVIQVAFHCCEVCGRTEVDDPTLEFRYCSKCSGRHEYCTDHIFEHDHKTE